MHSSRECPLGAMKILCWNCRGLASTAAVRSLLDVQKQWGSDVFFLSETHLNTVKAEKVRREVNMEHMKVVDSVGASGGLILFWRNPVHIK